MNPKICGIIQELAAKTESIFPWVSKEKTGFRPEAIVGEERLSKDKTAGRECGRRGPFV